MPTYEYRCEACGHELELFQGISESPKKKCPACKKSRLKRKIGGGAGFLFKGSGFYLTDYRSDSYRQAAEAESKPKDSDASPGPTPAAEKKSPSTDKPRAKKEPGRPASEPKKKKEP